MSKYTHHFALTTECTVGGKVRHLTLAGQWQDLAAYYQADDGTAWAWNNCTRSWSNCGCWEDFLAAFARGKYRGSLLDSTQPQTV